ncbi:MAG: [FeFe] hydrogenase H-cluster radical SAM maturase HydG [Candidatus Omnitrophica bacterium]|nr:[FeFe] hydrogenase H-cluster radical SAM maturase HydG [Candidatus Omnitrophota bacterium]
MGLNATKTLKWEQSRIKEQEISKYLKAGRDFIDDSKIESILKRNKTQDKKIISDIISKSLTIQTLTMDESAYLLNIEDKDLLVMMEDAALKVKKKVYDNRIVTFAPLYMSNMCVNDCLYCGFRKSNLSAQRRLLGREEVVKETEVLAGSIGHKRLIAVYGEHYLTDTDYIEETLRAIYSVKVKTKNGFGAIRRVNINAAPLAIADLKRLHNAGIGTYQVFQETYHHATYASVHPQDTIKGDYRWRLYSMHRAMEAGVDDVGLGVLFGLYDWKFDVMGLVAHTRDLEEKFKIGAHTISFPRLEPAENTPFTENPMYKVSDDDFKKLITVIRLAVPHTGMIITARENSKIRTEAIRLGITQTDASTRIGVGSYSDNYSDQDGSRQQFYLGDTRSLDEVIRELAGMGYITSFCTAGYRCGRTGENIMRLLRTGEEGKFCKLNAVLTFREWLDDFATEETRKVSEPLLSREINDIKHQMPGIYEEFERYYHRIKNGERDLYF